MRKLFLFCLNCLFFSFISLFSFSALLPAEAAARSVYVCGSTAGFLLNMGGVQVIAVSEIVTGEGCSSPAKSAGIRMGDIICKVGETNVTNVNELNACLNASGGKEVELTVKRKDGEEKKITVKPQKDVNGKYKIGVLIRDSLSGIGTITYIDKANGRFGALGHAVYDDENNILSVNKGKVYHCSIVSVTKGVRGKAGELKGLFVGDGNVGVSDKITDCGLYGKVDDNFDLSTCEKKEIAPLSQAHIGGAQIYSTVNGLQPEKFEVSIVKVDERNKENKNFVVKITDKTLIEQTGGIVQGMSGSPIVQDGKLIGAITHVFLNDPTRGYGIGIENMLDN